MIKNLTLYTGLIITFLCIQVNANDSSDYVKDHSAKVEALANKVNSCQAILSNNSLKDDSLDKQTPDTATKAFGLGKINLSSEGIIWTNHSGIKTTLVSNEGFEEGYSISGFKISPDSKKIAFYTTFNGQDLKFWNVVSVDKSPVVLLSEPIENRMQGFTWNKNSDGIYYSFWNDKEAVKKGEKPIIEQRFRNILTGDDSLVYDHGLAENFEIVDIDGGKTLVAYRLLNPVAGIKTTFSMYKGLLQEDGTYKFTSIYPRNQFVGVYLGRIGNDLYVQSGEAGDGYGIVKINALTNERTTIVPAYPNLTLHTAEVADDKLILQYHTQPALSVSLMVVDKDGKILNSKVLKDLGLTAYGDLSRFNFEPGAKVARAVFEDVMTGSQVLEFNLETLELSVVDEIDEIDFDSSKVISEMFSFTADDGQVIHARVHRRADVDSSFIFIRHYAFISIKNSPEVKEVQRALKLRGVYVSLHLPGGGEVGEEHFINGSRNRLKTIGYISQASSALQEKYNMTKEKVVVMGRSWGGMTSAVLAAKFGDNFGMINVVVPVIDVEAVLEEGWFGRIAHSDFAPLIDENGNYILDDDFYRQIREVNPIRIIDQMPNGVRLNLFTSGLDDRVDQGGDLEVDFARKIEAAIGSENFHYHRSIQGNHGGRYYQILMLSIIAKHYGLSLDPMKRP